MRLLCLDLATSLGWCAGDLDARPVFGTHRLPSTGQDVGRFLVAYDEWLRDCITLHDPARVVFEAPIIWSGKTAKDTARKLFGLASHTEFVCTQRSVRCSEGNLASVKKHLTGHGRASKDEMIAAARARGFDIRTEHEADAFGLFVYSAHCIRPNRAPAADPLMGRA